MSISSELFSCKFDQMQKLRGEVSWFEGDMREVPLRVIIFSRGQETPFAWNVTLQWGEWEGGW